jgi:hypothetical protein
VNTFHGTEEMVVEYPWDRIVFAIPIKMVLPIPSHIHIDVMVDSTCPIFKRVAHHMMNSTYHH